MGQPHDAATASPPGEHATEAPGASAHSVRLDVLACAVITLAIVACWLPTLTASRAVVANDDFLMHAARHEAVRKSILEHHTFPLRSHWFGGGCPTLGQPEDPSLNPLVLLSVLFGGLVGLKLGAFVTALASGLGTYALAHCVLGYTRWGALFSALIVGASSFVPSSLGGGNIGEACAAFLPVCMFLIGMACRGRRWALFALPFVLYTMLASGKQGFFAAIVFLALVCLFDLVPTWNVLTPAALRRRCDTGAIKVLVVALGVAFLVGMARILPMLEFVSAQGGLTHIELYPYASRLAGRSPPLLPLLILMGSGTGAAASLVATGWLPLLLFPVAAVCCWRRSLPWSIALVIVVWLALGDQAPLDLFGALQGLPVFSTMAVPYKFFAFQVVLCIALGAGQVFWLLGKLRRPWVEHVCALGLLIAGLGFLCPVTIGLQRRTATLATLPKTAMRQSKFFNVKGLNLPRNRLGPPSAVTYFNILQNVGTIDWYTATPLPEKAIPRFFVDDNNDVMWNQDYRGEAYLVANGATGPTAGPDENSSAVAAQAPNSIAVHVTTPQPCVLVVNQNYHPAWRSDRGELFNRDGLLAVRLTEAGSYVVRLRYHPWSFFVGLAVSLVSLAGWVVAFRLSSPARPGEGSSEGQAPFAGAHAASGDHAPGAL